MSNTLNCISPTVPDNMMWIWIDPYSYPYYYPRPTLTVTPNFTFNSENKGWVCIKCQKSWNPEVKGCEHCNK